MYRYGLVGNCQGSALISDIGSVDWLCMPRPDSPPVFGKLLDDDGGEFSVRPQCKFQSKQEYIPNTNVLVTTFDCEDGSKFKITDFFPRFEQHGRMYRPPSLFRIVEPLKGSPVIIVRCRAVNGWEKDGVVPVRGNSHFRYEMRGGVLRLTTSMSLTYLEQETPFGLDGPLHFAITWGTGIEDNLVSVTTQFLSQTIEYWKTWVKHCSIPALFQKETIRSALTLKLHCYEDTGAILAALTTSLPEEENGSRNWDYRFCWLRDAAFVLSAFHNLGHFEEMEGFLKFLLNVAHQHEPLKDRLRPVYGLDMSIPLPENEHSNWRGFKNSKPVRSNNQAAEHVQNDVYGEMLLTLAPVFFDERFQYLRTPDLEEMIHNLTTLCIRSISQKDAGLWELRNGWQEHSFSNLMCWAGTERVWRMKQKGFIRSLDNVQVEQALSKAEKAILNATFEGAVRNGPNDQSFDAALLLLPILRFPNQDVCHKTVLEIMEKLKFQDNFGFLYRYVRPDDFGSPRSSFLLCSFWLVQALSRIGEQKLAIQVMNEATKASNSLGLFSEHYLPAEKKQAGNFPQAYSHVGLINAAFSVSPLWSEVL